MLPRERTEKTKKGGGEMEESETRHPEEKHRKGTSKKHQINGTYSSERRFGEFRATEALVQEGD